MLVTEMNFILLVIRKRETCMSYIDKKKRRGTQRGIAVLLGENDTVLLHVEPFFYGTLK